MAAALLEKLITDAATARRLKRIRRRCVALIDHDAATFSRAIAATRTGRRRDFTRALKRATEVPYQVFADAHAIRAIGRATRQAIKPRFQSDVRCAVALAEAAARSSETLIRTNLTWLKDRAYTAHMSRRLRKACRPHVG